MHFLVPIVVRETFLWVYESESDSYVWITIGEFDSLGRIGLYDTGRGAADTKQSAAIGLSTRC